MRRRPIYLLLLMALTAASYFAYQRQGGKDRFDVVSADTTPAPGALEIFDAKGQQRGFCPLKHTAVKSEVSGFIANVEVTQIFQNPFRDKIEAVYTFPLPQQGAVYDMTMKIGPRTIRGKIKNREEARAIFESARSQGKVASLLDQERPNIFTQSVTNIQPGEQIVITISYVELLKYEDGAYEFVFPMVVGPRYIPGQPGTNAKVPDAERIKPPIAEKGTRAGHDISLELTLDAGVTIRDMKTVHHDVEVRKDTDRTAKVRLKHRNEIPNRDFIFRYDVAGENISDAVLTHNSDKGGYFTLILQPPERIAVEEVAPKELVFVLDTSGSMHGFPIEKAKETMMLALDGLYPQDTFNIITFAGSTHILFDEPVAASKQNIEVAKRFLASHQGGGGTEMMKAIRAALAPTESQKHIRIVCFMTDGYVGNDMQIIGEVQKYANARVFSFGIGSSVNRYLLDKMAEQGRGEVEYVSLTDDGSAAARRFHERIRNPLLTDISIDFGRLPVSEIYPQRIPDLFGAKPLILCGRYQGGGSGVIKLKGKMAGNDYTREIAVDLPAQSEPNRSIMQLWARKKIDELMNRDFLGIQNGEPKAETKKAIADLGIEFRLMTQYTSFVAVEERFTTQGGKARRVEVPVDMPEGVRPDSVEEGVAGGVQGGVVGGVSGGALSGIGGGTGSTYAPPPPAAPSPVQNSPVNLVKEPPRELPQVEAKPEPPPPSIIRRSEGVIRGSAIARPAPEYPPLARTARVTGDVVVEITIDENGEVASARVVSGHPLLQQAAIKAAQNWVFKPTTLDNIRIKVSGVLTFRFTDPDKAPAESTNSKLHAVVNAAINGQGQPTAPFIENGKASLVITLTDLSEHNLEQLKQLGLEIEMIARRGRLVIGKLSVDKIGQLAGLDFVTFVSPK